MERDLIDVTLVGDKETKTMPRKDQKIQLGHTVTDTLTGFQGIVTGIVYYLTGCNQALVTPKTTDITKYPDSYWIDVDRLVITGHSGFEPEPQPENPGSMEPPPKK